MGEKKIKRPVWHPGCVCRSPENELNLFEGQLKSRGATKKNKKKKKKRQAQGARAFPGSYGRRPFIDVLRDLQVQSVLR